MAEDFLELILKTFACPPLAGVLNGYKETEENKPQSPPASGTVKFVDFKTAPFFRIKKQNTTTLIPYTIFLFQFSLT